jgi:hypothetical protein
MQKPGPKFDHVSMLVQQDLFNTILERGAKSIEKDKFRGYVSDAIPQK